jgi:hypothetical protein
MYLRDVQSPCHAAARMTALRCMLMACALLTCLFSGCAARNARLDIPTYEVFHTYNSGIGVSNLQINDQKRSPGSIRMPPGTHRVGFNVGACTFDYQVALKAGKRYEARFTQTGIGSGAFLFCDIVDAATAQSVCIPWPHVDDRDILRRDHAPPAVVPGPQPLKIP